MGKSQKPLRITVLEPCLHWKEFEELESQGHTIIRAEWDADLINESDLVLGPTCWLMTEQHRKYLPLALAEARKRRYPKEPREQSE